MEWKYVTDVYQAIDAVIPDRVVLVGSAAIDAYLHYHGFTMFTPNDLDFIAMIDYRNDTLPDQISVEGDRYRTISGQSSLTSSKTFVNENGTLNFDLSKFDVQLYDYVELDGVKVLAPHTLIKDYRDGLDHVFLWKQKLNVRDNCETNQMENMYRQNLELKLSLLSIINAYQYDVKTINLKKPRESRFRGTGRSLNWDSPTTSPPYDHELGAYPSSPARALYFSDSDD